MNFLQRWANLKGGMVSVLLLTLGACATLPERQAYGPDSPTYPVRPCEAACQLHETAIYARATEAEMLSKLHEQRRYRAVLRSLTFGTAIGTALALSYDGSRDLTVGLGLATGGLAGVSALTTERGYAATYLAAADASACIMSATTLMSAPIDMIELGQRTISGDIALLSRLLAQIATLQVEDDTERASGLPDSTMRARADAAIAVGGAAIERAEMFEASGLTFARRARVVIDDIVSEARKQIAAQEPDQDAFAAALANIRGLATTETAGDAALYSGGTAASKIGGPFETSGGIAPRSSGDLAKLQAEAEVLIASIKGRAALLHEEANTASADAAAKLATCRGLQAVPEVAPLTVAGAPGNAVSIGAGERIILSAAGGQGGYEATWVGKAPTQIELRQVGNRFELTGATSLGTSQPFTLVISDKATTPQSREIMVMTH